MHYHGKRRYILNSIQCLVVFKIINLNYKMIDFCIFQATVIHTERNLNTGLAGGLRKFHIHHLVVEVQIFSFVLICVDETLS